MWIQLNRFPRRKKSWMHTNPNICHLWHTSNRCTILDINLYSGYPHKSKQIKIFQKFTTFKKFEKQPILSVILDWPISRRLFTLMLIGQRFQPNRTSAQVRQPIRKLSESIRKCYSGSLIFQFILRARFLNG